MKKNELVFLFVLLPLDIIGIVLAFVAAYYLRARIEITPLSQAVGLFDYLKYALYLLPIWILFFSLNGLYTKGRLPGLLPEFYRIFIASSTAILVLIVIIFLSKSLFFSRIILVLTWLLAILFIFIGRAIWRLYQLNLYRQGYYLRRVIIVGYTEATKALIDQLKREPALAFQIVGIISDKHSDESGVRYLGEYADLDEVARKSKVDDLILTDSSLSQRKIVELMKLCDELNLNFKYVPDVYSMMAVNFQQSMIGTLPIMESKAIPLDGWGRISKRICDIIFSSFFIIILSPILLIIAILVKLTSKGPVLYTHTRVGRDEREFKFFKFRSMYSDKCDWKETGLWTTASDDKVRVTPFGRFIRKTNLDELPQLFNIFLGNMSFVGPRPELPKLVEKFENEIPDYFRRHRVKAGLTGWAQVNGLKGDTSITERVKFDIYYIENWSLWFDAKIIIKTVWLIIYEALAGKSEYRTRP
ncbi:MAG: undecaprenyl-phosphate glucose phosphotransferase [Candidatus Berkelbacteria bacterium]|nr:undecaprenyl-phosphate glucose phosphotransferase [Candidatus Berkelbacteria bacterium]